MSANCSWIIILISVERWVAVCKPWQKARLFTNKRVAMALICIFLSSLILFIYFPFSLHIIKTESEEFAFMNITEADTTYECKIKYENLYNSFGTVSVLLVYIIPYFVLTILNIMIIIKLQLRPLARMKNTATIRSNTDLTVKYRKSETDNTDVNLLSVPSQIVTQETNSTKNFLSSHLSASNNFLQQFSFSRIDRSLSISLVTVAITFIILTCPFQALWFKENFLKQFQIMSNPNNQSSTLVYLNLNDSLLFKTYSQKIFDFEEISSINFNEFIFIIKNMNYLINFVLYSALSKMFRQEFIALLTENKFLKPKKKSTKKENSSIANISFSMKAFKNIKTGANSSRSKYIQIKIEPSNFFKYFKLKSHKEKSSNKQSLRTENVEITIFNGLENVERSLCHSI